MKSKIRQLYDQYTPLFVLVLTILISIAGIGGTLFAVNQMVLRQEEEFVALGVSHFTSVEPNHWFSAQKQETIEVTSTWAITPTGTFQPIDISEDYQTPPVNITTCLAITSTYSADRDPHLSGVLRFDTGSELQLMNLDVSTTLVITECRSAKLVSTAVYLNAYDTLFLIFDGTYWVQKSHSNN
jgi:hypothetical protein